MTLECLCREAISRYQNVKVGMCTRRHGPAPLTAIVEATFPHKKARFVTTLDGNPRVLLDDALNQIGSVGLPENVVVLFDAYSSESTPEDYCHGMLADDFKSNLLSSVRELLGVVGINVATGNQHSILVPYGYGDEGLPVFGPHIDSKTHTGGFVADTLSTWCSEIRSRRKRKRR